MPEAAPSRRSGATLIQLGILLSRMVGMVRQTIFAACFGNGPAAAAFNAALRIPNFLQNLFGEGVLSASFIPVYASLLGREDREEADRVAGAVFGLLALANAVLVALGIAFAPQVVDLIAGGFSAPTRELTIHLVRVIFPGTGLLVMSAWCLGVLNSHGRFFLSYAAPVIWSGAQMAMMIGFRGETQEKLAVWTALGVSIGSALQFGVQLPQAVKLLGGLRVTLDVRSESVAQVLKNFGPVVVSRGVVQVSAYLDAYYASLISEVVFSAMTYAQTLYLLPVSLFGMAISAAELPEMSRDVGTTEEVAARLRKRIDASLERIAFFVVPSAMAFVALGDVVAGAVFQHGHFTAADTRFTWYLLAGSAVGLLATTSGRLYSTSFYALKDTRTPLRAAVVRVVATALMAYVSAVKLPGWLGVPRELGGVGIIATTGLAAWIEYQVLKRRLTQRIGATGISASKLLTFWSAAALAAACALGTKAALVGWFGPEPLLSRAWGGDVSPFPHLKPLLVAPLVLGVYGGLYLGLTAAAGVSPLLDRLKARFKRK